MSNKPIKTKPLKPKLFVIRDTDGAPQMLVRAKTTQGALTFAASKLMLAELADQQTLVDMTKAGIEAVDAIEPGDDMLGARSVNAQHEIHLPGVIG